MASPILDRIYNLRLANYDDSVTKIKNLTVLFEKLDATAKEMKAQLNIKANLSDTSAIDKLNTRIKELETETEKLKTQLVANTKEANLLFTNAGKIGDEFSALGEAIRAAEEPIANINQGLDEGARALAELKLRASENSTQQKTLKAAYADGRITLNEFTTSMGALIQREHELKVQVSDLTLQQREFAKENNSVSGSMEQAAIRLGRLRDEYRSLTDEEKAAPFGKNLLSTIQQLDAQIKAADGSIGNFQRNVGNYANAFSGAFSIVKKDLDDIRNKISSGTFNSEELQTFQQQEAALAGALESLNKEFTTTRAQGTCIP
jgi:chromosome segregation ATPase